MHAQVQCINRVHNGIWDRHVPLGRMKSCLPRLVCSRMGSKLEILSLPLLREERRNGQGNGNCYPLRGYIGTAIRIQNFRPSVLSNQRLKDRSLPPNHRSHALYIKLTQLLSLLGVSRDLRIGTEDENYHVS